MTLHHKITEMMALKYNRKIQPNTNWKCQNQQQFLFYFRCFFLHHLSLYFANERKGRINHLKSHTVNWKSCNSPTFIFPIKYVQFQWELINRPETYEWFGIWIHLQILMTASVQLYESLVYFPRSFYTPNIKMQLWWSTHWNAFNVRFVHIS